MSALTTYFVAGGLTAGYLVGAGFFLRFRRRTGDRLFALFAAAFLLLAAQRALLAWSFAGGRDATWLYGVRLLAFVLILVAIVDKNRKA